MSETLLGSCLCGGVRFEVTEPFTLVSQCHCASCKKLSGGYGTVSGRARTEAIRILEGEELLRSYTPAEGSCQDVLLRMRLEPLRRRVARRRAGARSSERVDSEFDRKPEAHTFVRSVADWEILPEDGLPRYDARMT